MKRVAFILSLIILSGNSNAQVLFKTIVPSEPVIAGESFRVQYFAEDASAISNFLAPDFRPFRMVAGPDIYPGEMSHQNNFRQSKNYVFTLVATTPGKYIIPGAVINNNGKQIKSNAVMIEIISKDNAQKKLNKEAAVRQSEYYLRPGEDVYQKIRQNLFIKVVVDKKSCFVGQPVLATFKLFSRLESKSDIVKNPGFYGFTVYDMVSLADKQLTTEYVNGKPFDVHMIRKVQLYPLQAGTFIIDPMEVKNKVEFSRSVVNKKTEQQIVEGMLNSSGDTDLPAEGAEVVETEISTAPVSIEVKPVPEKNKSNDYTGAVGMFTIAAKLEKSDLKKNEEGFLEIIISGNGNFTQLGSPSIQWPSGIEGFDPLVLDSVDKAKIPLAGKRKFRYGFVCASHGKYVLPAISFSFFDPDSNKYKTISTKPLLVSVSNEEKKTIIIEEKKTSIAAQSEKISRIAIGVVVFLVLTVLAYWTLRKREPAVPTVIREKTYASVEESLQSVRDLKTTSDKELFKELYEAIWKHLSNYFILAGTEKNAHRLLSILKEKGAGIAAISSLNEILSDCEAGMYANASLSVDKEELLKRTKAVLEEIDKTLL